jgi:hypothetical protein
MCFTNKKFPEALIVSDRILSTGSLNRIARDISEALNQFQALFT